MLLLDLQAEVDPQYIRLESFYGQPFIFCLLHNFGGTLGMYGVMGPLAQVNRHLHFHFVMLIMLDFFYLASY